jgi:hypothetical protein
LSPTVTLIHGTWAPERIRGRERPEAVPYPRSGGWPLATELLARYPTADPYLLRWSGGNSVRDRRRAAAALVRHVRAVHRRKPGRTHILIGHSHGGTVAYYALASPALRRLLAGVVCLSTPFVTFSPRPAGDARVLQFTLGLATLMLLVLLTGGGDVMWVPLTFDSPAPTPVPSTETTWQEIVGAVVALTLLVGARPAWRRMQAAAARFLRRAALPELGSNSVTLLLVRSPSDEASGGLAASQFLAWALLQLGRTLLLPFGGTFGRTMLSPRQIWAAFLPMFVIISSVVSIGAVVGYILQREVSLPVVPVLVGLLAAVPILMLAFSRDTAAHALFIHTSVEPCPPGHWLIHQLGPHREAQIQNAEPPTPRALWERLWRLLQWNPWFPSHANVAAPSAPPLMHSITYQDPRAVQLVATFVESRLRAQMTKQYPTSAMTP